MSDTNCKHNDLIVQRNYGYRWVTCSDCLTDFIPEPTPADVLELARSLEGAKVHEGPFEYFPPDDARYLVIPLPDEEE